MINYLDTFEFSWKQKENILARPMCRDTSRALSYVLFLFSMEAPGIASKDRIFLVGEHGPSNGACDVITLCFRFLHSKEEKYCMTCC